MMVQLSTCLAFVFGRRKKIIDYRGCGIDPSVTSGRIYLYDDECLVMEQNGKCQGRI